MREETPRQVHGRDSRHARSGVSPCAQALRCVEQLGVLTAAEQSDDLSDGLRIVITEWRRFHLVPEFCFPRNWRGE
jgi:hypothetical protein